MSKISSRLRAIAFSAMLTCVTTSHANGAIELNFANASIDSVATAVGAMMGKNVIIDPKVKGTITLTSEVPVTNKQALAMFQDALRLNGFAMLDTGQVYKVVPAADAKTSATKVGGSAEGAEVVTRVFHLKHEHANNILGAVKPLVSPFNTVNISQGANALIVTDYADNVDRIGRLIASIDVDTASEIEILPLQHAMASEMAPLLQYLLELPSKNGNSNTGDPIQSTLIADNRSNSLIIRGANSAKTRQIKSMLERLDQPAMQSESSAGNLHVVHLKHADAVALAETLRAAIRTLEQTAPIANNTTTTGQGSLRNLSNQASMPASQSSQDSGGLSNTGPLNHGQPQMPSVGGLVQADPNTNSLIITAPAPLFRQLRTVIDKLDTRRAQVLVESMIVEVSDTKLAEFGIQWQAALTKTLAVGTNSGVAGANILGLSAGIASGDVTALSGLGGGMNIAIAPKQFGQQYLGALANFLQTDGSTNVMSKPNLITLDNEEARIIIGNNVPFVTGSYANTGGTGTVNPFTTVERKDVGLMLRIKPTINENGTVKLVVSQEASSIDSSTLKDPNGLTTNKRSIESTVLVEDGSIVMLGGLMQDNFTQAEDKVPLLGDVPLVGGLFRSESRKRNKTNLMIFLRPFVVRDAQTSEALAMGRYQEMRALQTQTQPKKSVVMGNVNEAPVMPQMRTQPTSTSIFVEEVREEVSVAPSTPQVQTQSVQAPVIFGKVNAAPPMPGTQTQPLSASTVFGKANGALATPEVRTQPVPASTMFGKANGMPVMPEVQSPSAPGSSIFGKVN